MPRWTPFHLPALLVGSVHVSQEDNQLTSYIIYCYQALVTIVLTYSLLRFLSPRLSTLKTSIVCTCCFSISCSIAWCHKLFPRNVDLMPMHTRHRQVVGPSIPYLFLWDFLLASLLGHLDKLSSYSWIALQSADPKHGHLASCLIVTHCPQQPYPATFLAVLLFFLRVQANSAMPTITVYWPSIQPWDHGGCSPWSLLCFTNRPSWYAWIPPASVLNEPTEHQYQCLL